MYIYINLPVNAIARLLHSRSGDSQEESFCKRQYVDT